MSTYFEKLQRNYKDVPVTDEGIDTVAFLEATEGVVKLFDLLNSKAFTMVQKDMNGNIEKIKKRYNTDPKKNNTLENLVINEKGEKTRTATEGLLWLKRGLEFTSLALRSSLDSAKSANASEELSNSFTKSYEVTLKKFHGVLVRPVFKMAMTYCPSRQELFQKLGDDQNEVNRQFEEWLVPFEQIVKRLDEFYKQGGHDKGF